MLITHPTIMFKVRAMLFLHGLMSLFPKVLCMSILTWAFWVHLVNSGVLADRGHVASSSILIGLSVLFYVLCAYTYFKVIHLGPGSPLDYSQLRIKDLLLLNGSSYNKNGTARQKTNTEYEPTQQRGAELQEAIESREVMDSREGSESRAGMESQEGVESRENVESREGESQDQGGSLHQNGPRGPVDPPSDYMIVHDVMRKKGRSEYKVCTKCSVWKPDRCHHCLATGKCILRMDHYCPWFAACIGYQNQKIFVQFLIYTTIFAGVCFVESAWSLWSFIAGGLYTEETISINLVLLVVMLLLFFFALAMFTGFQIYMVLRNLTTIELSERNGNSDFSYQFDYRGRKQKLGHIYDLGCSANWRSIMGETWFAWMFPVQVSTRDPASTFRNGVNFEVNEAVYAQWVENANLQSQLNEQLYEYGRRRQR